MKNVLKAVGITIALTAIVVAMRANKIKKQRSKINGELAVAKAKNTLRKAEMASYESIRSLIEV